MQEHHEFARVQTTWSTFPWVLVIRDCRKKEKDPVVMLVLVHNSPAASGLAFIVYRYSWFCIASSLHVTTFPGNIPPFAIAVLKSEKGFLIKEMHRVGSKLLKWTPLALIFCRAASPFYH